MNDLEQEVKTLIEQTRNVARMNGQVRIQTAIYRWILEHHDKLQRHGLKDSLIECCEKAIKE